MTHGRKFGVTFNIRLFNFNSLFFCHFALLARKSHILSSLELCGKSKFQLCLLAMRNIVFFSSRTKRKSRARQERKFKSSKVSLRSKKRSFAVNLELRFPRPFFDDITAYFFVRGYHFSTDTSVVFSGVLYYLVRPYTCTYVRRRN